MLEGDLESLEQGMGAGKREGLEPVRFYPGADGADWPGYFSDLPFNDVRT